MAKPDPRGVATRNVPTPLRGPVPFNDDISTQGVALAADDAGNVLVASVLRLTGEGSPIVWLLDQTGSLAGSFDGDGGWGFVDQETPCDVFAATDDGLRHWSGPAATWVRPVGSSPGLFAAGWTLGCRAPNATIEQVRTGWFDATGLVSGLDSSDLPAHARAEAQRSRITLVDLGGASPAVRTVVDDDANSTTYVRNPTVGAPIPWHEIHGGYAAELDEYLENAFKVFLIAGAATGEADHIGVGRDHISLYDSRTRGLREEWTRLASIRPFDISDGVRDPTSGDVFVTGFTEDAALVGRFNSALDPVSSYGTAGIASFVDPDALFTKPYRMARDDTGRVHIVGCSRVVDASLTRIDPHVFYARLGPDGSLEVVTRVREIASYVDDEVIEMLDIAVPPGSTPRVVIGGKLARPMSRGRIPPRC